MKKIQFLVSAFLFLSSVTHAQTFSLPSSDQSIIGELQYTSIHSETTSEMAHHYDLGQNSIVAANPTIAEENGRLPPNGTLTIPSKFLLPPLPREGIVVNLPEMRLYYYPKNSNAVMTFPIGIGKIGKIIPIKSTSITRKVVNPTWTPPEDIRQFNREKGIELPYSMGPGPDNPLGPYAIYLRIPTYLIHSTIFPESIGSRASFGCIRMNEDDIKQFFPSVTPGTPVVIIDMPNKIAWNNSHLYLEAHPPLEERSESASLNNAVQAIQARVPDDYVVLMNWQMVSYLTEQPDGIPHEVGVRVR